MTKNPKTVQSGHGVSEALKYFHDHNLHFAPVVTPLSEILGVITDFLLVKAAIKSYMNPGRLDKVIHHESTFEQPTFVYDDDTLEDVIKALTKAPSHRLLVTNKQEKLVGVISPKDVMKLIMGNDDAAVGLRDELQRTKEKAEELEHKVEDLQESLQIYQGLFTNSPYMMHSVDSKGKIVMANKKIHTTLGYKDGELIGKSMAVIYPPSELPEASEGLSKIKESGFHNMVYTSFLQKTGDKIRIDIASSALKDRAGNFLCTITISRVVDSDELLKALSDVMEPKADVVKDLS